MQPDEKIILIMKQGTMREMIRDIHAIPDQIIRARLLTFFYYMAEFEFTARFQYYVPPRLLSDNPVEDITRWTNSARDFNDAQLQVLEAMLYYVADRSEVQLQAMSTIAAAVLERHKLALVDGLDEVFT